MSAVTADDVKDAGPAAGAGEQAMERRYFTLAEANAMIPRLEAAFGRVMQMRLRLKAVFRQLDDRGYAPESDDFEVVVEGAPEGVAQARAVLKGLVEALRDELVALDACGCVVKDVETGLVDWFSRRQGRDIFLCWRLGEEEVGHWHDIDAGFAGRRPVSEL